MIQDIRNHYRKLRRKKKLKKQRAKTNKPENYKSRYNHYLKSKKWAEIRLDLFMVRGRKCENCGNKKHLQVHHINYNNVFKEEPSDLIILCRLCHEKEHGL